MEERDWQGQGLGRDPTTFEKNPEREPALIVRLYYQHVIKSKEQSGEKMCESSLQQVSWLLISCYESGGGLKLLTRGAVAVSL